MGTTRPDIVSNQLQGRLYTNEIMQKHNESSGRQLMFVGILGSFQRTSVEVHQRQSVNKDATVN